MSYSDVGRTTRREAQVYLGDARPEDYGFKRPLKVYAHVGLGRQSDCGYPREWETTDHRTVFDPIELSVTFSVRKSWAPSDWVSGGAMGEKGLAVVAERKASAETFDRLRRLLPWHLNNAQAGCDHQQVEYETNRYGRRVPSLTLTPPCPITGYRYGRAWLVRELPPEIVADAVALGAGVPAVVPLP